MNQDTNKAAIVTGGSRGIGAAIAQRLAADGFAVTVNYCRQRKGGRRCRQGDWRRPAGGRLPSRATSAIPPRLRKLFDETERAFGGVDVLVNNAGILTTAAARRRIRQGF